MKLNMCKAVLAAAVVVGLTTVFAAPDAAQATLIGDDVTVKFIEPGFPDEVDVVTVGPGPEIVPVLTPPTNIGTNILLDGESIDIGDSPMVGFDTSIVYNVRGDGPGGTTGFDPAAKYEFSDLDFSLSPIPGIITGIEITLSNVSGVGLGSEVFFTENSLDLVIGTLTVGPIAGGPDLGMITLNLEVTPVPEPATLVLFGTGLAGLGLTRRRRQKP